MDLRKFDGQCVRITLQCGDVYDGICTYNDQEYDEHEFGVPEESLEMMNCLFYKSDIKTVESLEDHTGPYGRFLDPYGKLEEEAVQDGIMGIEDGLFCEENEHVIRMLRCLDEYLNPDNRQDFPCPNETFNVLRELIKTTDDNEVKEEAKRLIDKWESSKIQN